MSQDPYRDDRVSLRAENERLRSALAVRRSPRSRPVLAVATAAADVVAYVFLRSWLNGNSDALFWGALLVLVGLAVAAAAFALGFPRTRTRSTDESGTH